MTDTPNYSLHVLLPPTVDRRLARWAEATPGASWPEWGGHITLLPAFSPTTAIERVRQALRDVAERHTPFDVHLTSLTVVQDWTREQYRAVFLTPPEQIGSGLRRLLTLQHNLDIALRNIRADRYPAINRREYVPHVTLALGLSDTEAHQMVGAARAQGLAAEFTADRIWLKRNGPGQPGALGGGMESFPLDSPLPSG